MTNDHLVGRTVVHRRYVPYSHAHYAGDLVDGAYSLAAFGDVAHAWIGSSTVQPHVCTPKPTPGTTSARLSGRSSR